MRTAIVIALVGMATPAYAQRAPDFATLDRGDGITRLGLDLGLDLLKQPPYDAALRIEPYGQYVWRNGFGLYGDVPFAVSFGGGDESTATLGNLELGTLYVISGETASLVLRGGLALPTAGSSASSVATNQLATFPRITDTALGEPNALYLRLGVSPLIHENHVFLQADLGIDVGIDTNDDAFDVPHIARLNLGAGYDFDALALGVELANIVVLDSVDNNEQLFSTLALTMRFMGKSLQPVLALGLPLDDSLRDRATLFLSLGLQYAFR